MSDQPINPHDAPEGYVARRAEWQDGHPTCEGCAFMGGKMPQACIDAPCMPASRADGQDVIFTPRAEPGE